MKEDKIKVGSYERKKPKPRKPEPMDGTGIEVPHVAPSDGPGIVNVGSRKPQNAVPAPPRAGGVQIIGGGSAGRRGDLNVRTKRS